MNLPMSTRTRYSLMPATWEVSCAASLRPVNGSGIAQVAAMPNCLPSIIFRTSQHEHAGQTVRALQAGPDHATQSLRHGAPDAQPRRATGHGAEPARDRVL